jgi:hypothetical protein
MKWTNTAENQYKENQRPYPMKRDVFKKRFPKRERIYEDLDMICESSPLMSMKVGAPGMGLAPGDHDSS